MFTKNKRIFFIAFTLLLFIIEVLIAVFVNDKIIRPYIGDVLVTLLIYCFIRIFLPDGIKKLPLYVFIFSCFVELLQYFNFVELIGLSDNTLARIVIGTSFSWIDIICYGVGCLLCYFLEQFYTPFRIIYRK